MQPAPSATPRILGIDVGGKRIGTALTDALGFAAHPLLTLGGDNPKQAYKSIGRILRKYEVAAIVVGHPLHISGQPSPQAAQVQVFAAGLRDAFNLPVYLQDERLTSHAAHELMDRLGLPRGPGRQAKLDQYAAVIILQDWLDGQARADIAPLG